MKPFRKALLALTAAACLSVAVPVSAVSYSIDQSDLWYIPAESGWGMQLVERKSTIFATLYVYDPSNNPVWYVATMNFVGATTWSGDLYATTGPWFGTVPFNPAAVTATQVGTMSWTLGANPDSGTVSYTVNGTSVTKNVVRETLVTQDYSGHFSGLIHQLASNCTNPTFDVTTDTVTVLDVAQNGAAITLTSTPAGGPTCTYNGTLTQNGQMGDVSGTYSCTNGFAGNFDISAFQVTPVSVNGFLFGSSSNPGNCLFEGWLGGVSVTTF